MYYDRRKTDYHTRQNKIVISQRNENIASQCLQNVFKTLKQSKASIFKMNRIDVP